MYVKGIKPKQIADVLNSENILTPSDYHYSKIGKPNPHYTFHRWGSNNVRGILDNPIYIGNLVQHRIGTISYKNKKVIRYDESDWIVVKNNHKSIISKEMWEKAQEVRASTSTGRQNKKGEIAPLSGFLYCDSCGTKMRLNIAYKGARAAFSCGLHARGGKDVCSSHRIIRDVIEDIVLEDIHSMITLTVNEAEARQKFLERKSGLRGSQTNQDKKRMTEVKYRLTELDRMIQSIYEDKVNGKVSEELCLDLLEKYQAEKKKLQTELDEITERLETENQDEHDVDEFICRLKKYVGVETLTREMALELIEYITVDECVPRSTEPRTIHIYYKLLDKGLKDKRNALM